MSKDDRIFVIVVPDRIIWFGEIFKTQVLLEI